MLKKEELESLSRALQMDIMLLGAKINKKQQKQDKLQIAISKLNYNLNEKKRTQENIKKLLLLEEPFNEELIKARAQLVAIIREQKDENVAMNRQKDLDILYRNETEKLKQMPCDHRLVIGHFRYNGAYSNNYNDTYPGYRQCIICGFDEYGNKPQLSGEEIYNILNRKEDRIIQLMDKNVFFEFDIWRPLPDIMQWFKEKYFL